MIKTVMFDLDGTLLPFEQEEFIKLYFGGLCKKLAPHGYDPDSVVKYVWKGTKAMTENDGSRFNEEAFWELFRKAFPDKPDAREFCDDFYTKEFDGVKACLKYVPDHGAMLGRLRSAGFETVLATNPLFPQCAVATRLAWAGLREEDFVYITNYSNSRFCKPNPKYFTELLGKLGREPSECVMVGNSVPEDILPTKALGIEGFLASEFSENPTGEDITGLRSGTLAEAEEWILSLK